MWERLTGEPGDASWKTDAGVALRVGAQRCEDVQLRIDGLAWKLERF